MNADIMVLLFAMFCLMLAFMAVFARPETAMVLVKTLRDVITELFKHYLP